MTEVYTVFTKDNVLAIRAGRKWQTRRVINPQPRRINDDFDGTWEWKEVGHYFDDLTLADMLRRYCLWQSGDLMCVKEGYQIASNYGTCVNGYYLADDALFSIELTSAEFARWKARKYPHRSTSGRFMYRSLCRVKRPVIRSWVEQVAIDISKEDAIAEGVEQEGSHWKCYSPKCGCYGQYTALASFRTLWDSINPKMLFETNPWIWAGEFERHTDE